MLQNSPNNAEKQATEAIFLSQAIIENDCDGLKNFATIVAIDKYKMIL